MHNGLSQLRGTGQTSLRWKQTMAIHALTEGNSIRLIERMTGIHRDTIMRLGVKVGQACATLMDEKMRNLSLGRIEVDEIWGFIGKKQKQVTRSDDDQPYFETVSNVRAQTQFDLGYPSHGFSQWITPQ